MNLAARLVALAGPGETLLSEDVYRALAYRAACETLGETEVKGFDVPVRIWRLDGLSSDAAPANGSAFVGRVAELEQFKGYLRQRSHGEAARLCVRGEPHSRPNNA